MKVKFLLKQLNKQSSIKPIEILDLSQNIIETKAILTTTKREEVFEYRVDQNNEQVIKIKEAISCHLKVTPDALQLFLPSQLHQEMYDGDSLTKYFNLDGSDISMIYRINNISVKVQIDFYQNNIEKLSLKLASTCSLLIVKHLIYSKLLNNLPVSEQKLYCIGLLDKTKKILVKGNNNKQFEDSVQLTFIISSYNSNEAFFERERPIPSDNIIIHFLLVRQSNKKLQMGLNFKFNHFKSLTKVSFNSNAPNYRECSDGINLFSYCRNKVCSIYNELFVIILGYGCFDIIRETYRVICPKCSNNQLEVKNIGLINAKWSYKGILSTKKENIFDGDGITLDDKLYLLPEANIINTMNKLFIEAKPYKSVEMITNNNLQKANDSSSLDSLSLNLPNEGSNTNSNNNKHPLKSSLNKEYGIQIYENESEFDILNIQIEKEEQNECNGCHGNTNGLNGCLLF